jgi:hypothetical protein
MAQESRAAFHGLFRLLRRILRGAGALACRKNLKPARLLLMREELPEKM